MGHDTRQDVGRDAASSAGKERDGTPPQYAGWEGWRVSIDTSFDLGEKKKAGYNAPRLKRSRRSLADMRTLHPANMRKQPAMRTHGRSFDGKNICGKTFPGIGDAGKALATPRLIRGSPECRRQGACVKTSANIGGPPCMKTSAGKGRRVFGNNMPGHAAHEAQQGGAERRHKAVAAAATDKTLPYGIGACRGQALITPFAGLEVLAAFGGSPQLFTGQHAQHAAASGGQDDVPMEGTVGTAVALSFMAACGILGGG